MDKEKLKNMTILNRDGLENSDHWETPEWLFDELNEEFNFDFDPCPLNSNFDGLKIEWGKSNFVNPPYNRIDKPKFIQKAFEEWKKGKTCVLLLPSATGTKQFHDLILPNAEIRFLKGRVAFKGINTKGVYSTTNKGKHDSMICIFRGNHLKNDYVKKRIRTYIVTNTTTELMADFYDEFWYNESYGRLFEIAQKMGCELSETVDEFTKIE